jgi:hypothetical protein
VEIYLLLAGVFVSAVCSAYAAVMAFRLQQSIDAIEDFIERFLTEEQDKPHGRRVTIARDYEMPDELEASMERRASKPPMS